MLLYELTELEHDLLPAENALVPPGREGFLGRLDCSIHFLLGGTGHSTEQLIGGRIVVVNPPVCLGLYKLAIDHQLD